MDHHDLTGYYTYRSLFNRQEPADDFNEIRFGEGELFLYVAPDGNIMGTLAFPADPLAGAKDFMDVTGRVTGWSPPTVELEGVGRSGLERNRLTTNNMEAWRRPTPMRSGNGRHSWARSCAPSRTGPLLPASPRALSP
jgi:hypothetical protein